MNEDDARKIASSEEAFRLHMISSTVRLETKMDSVCSRTDSLEKETTAQGKAIAALQVKSGLWGAIGAFLVLVGAWLKAKFA